MVRKRPRRSWYLQDYSRGRISIHDAQEMAAVLEIDPPPVLESSPCSNNSQSHTDLDGFDTNDLDFDVNGSESVDASGGETHSTEYEEDAYGNEFDNPVGQTQNKPRGEDRTFTGDASLNTDSTTISSNENSVELTPLDEATLDLLHLCHDAGTSLEFFDNLVALLRKHSRNNNSKHRNSRVDLSKLPKRKTFLKNLREKINCPKPIITMVRDIQVPHFDILHQLRDLLSSSLFLDLNNLCVNLSVEDRFSIFAPTEDDKFVEMSAQQWYQKTYAECINNPLVEFLVPLILYIDETGTDVFQRYPLEPLMFTLGLLRGWVREKSSSWRHAGFIPKIEKSDDPVEHMQHYHECMRAILSTLKPLQDNPPEEWVTLGDRCEKKTLIIQIAFVMGDQKSQDNHCARKASNSGGAARAHRGCMCPSTHAADTSQKCSPVSKKVVDDLRDIVFEGKMDSVAYKAILSKYPIHDPSTATHKRDRLKKERDHALKFIQRRAALAKDILSEVFTMHPIRNAFDGLGFGATPHSILSATTDDPMHFNESGYFDYMGKVSYLCMTKLEQKEFETRLQYLYCNTRSSVRQEFPKTRVNKGFTNMTLQTSNEKVGASFSMIVALHDNRVYNMMENIFQRQQHKYLTFPIQVSQPKGVKSKNENRPTNLPSKLIAKDKSLLTRIPLRNNYHYGRDRNEKEPFPRTVAACESVFHHLKHHGLGFLLDLDLAELQLEYLFVVAWSRLKNLDAVSYYSDCILNIIPGFPFVRKEHDNSPFSENDTDSESSESDFPVRKSKVEVTYLEKLHDTASLRSTQRGDMIVVPRDYLLAKTEKTNESGVVGSAPLIEKWSSKNQTVAVTFPKLRRKGVIQKHGCIKVSTKGDGNTSAVLASVDKYIELVEISLCMHAYLHYSSDMPLELRNQTEVIDFGIRRVMKMFTEYIYRGDNSVDSDTCKIHSHQHIVQNLIEWGDATQYDAGKGERGLKDWAKGISRTAQKCGIIMFLNQTISRVADYQLINKARDLNITKEVRKRNKCVLEDGEKSLSQKIMPPKTGMLRKIPHYRFNTQTKALHIIDRKGKMTLCDKPNEHIDKRILIKIVMEDPGLISVDLWCEIVVSNDSIQEQRFRAHPTFDRYGPMYDWAAIEFKLDDSSTQEGQMGPAKLLVFYADDRGIDCAIVHAACTTTGRETRAKNTLLVQDSYLEFTLQGQPALRKVPIADINHCLLVHEHHSLSSGPLPNQIEYRTERNKYLISAIETRTNWAFIFHKWASELVGSPTPG